MPAVSMNIDEQILHPELCAGAGKASAGIDDWRPAATECGSLAGAAGAGVAPPGAAAELGGVERRGGPRGARLVGAGHPARRPRGVVVHQLRRVGRDAHGLRAGRGSAGQRESRLPLARVAIHAYALANEGALPVAQGQARRLRGDSGTRAAWARPRTRAHHLFRCAGVAGAARRRGPAAGPRGRGRHREHPVHQRDDGTAEGRDADASQRGEQRAVPGRRDFTTPSRTRLWFRCRSSTATDASSAP